MRGKKAKMLRKAVYSDFSQREKQYNTDTNGTIRCVGLRAQYLTLKKQK